MNTLTRATLISLVYVSIAHANLNPPPFVPTEKIKPRVEFWIRIFTQYHTRQGLIHDAKYFDRVYEVLELTENDRLNKKLTRLAERKWESALRSLHKKTLKTRGDRPEVLTEDEKHVWDLFSDINERSKFREAAHPKRLRIQLGQKDQFLKGLIESGQYLPRMEEIFKAQGVPPELTRLPFVESSFNVKARSKVGASGVWQLMRETGRRYLRIHTYIDERNDPFFAAEAAARFLRDQNENLQNWPITITAYNHGPAGMARAVRKVKERNIDRIIEEYRSPNFKFASQNFYAEFLAAVLVEAQAEKYFGKVERKKPIASFEVELPDAMRLRDLCSLLGYEKDQVIALNPAFSTLVAQGRAPIPAKTRLRLPVEKLSVESAQRVFAASYEKIPPTFKLKQPRLRVKH